MSPQIPDAAPVWSEVPQEDAEVELQGCDMYVRYDGWEYYLGEENGPCRPSVDLDGYYTSLRFYDDKALVIHEIPEDDQTWEIGFRVRNVYPEDSVE